MRIEIKKYPALADLKQQSYADIDAAAGAARARYITVAPGQSETYQENAADAAAYANAGYPADSTPYPWVHAEATALGVPAAQVAQTITATKAAWITLGTGIEALRMKGKALVNQASTEAQVLTTSRGYIAALNNI